MKSRISLILAATRAEADVQLDGLGQEQATPPWSIHDGATLFWNPIPRRRRA
jgi:hypothetical protein